MKFKVDVRFYDDEGKSADIVVEIDAGDVRQLAEEKAIEEHDALSADAGRIECELCW